MESSSRINILDTQLSSLKQEKSKLTAELEMCKIKLSTLQDERNRWERRFVKTALALVAIQHFKEDHYQFKLVIRFIYFNLLDQLDYTV